MNLNNLAREIARHKELMERGAQWKGDEVSFVGPDGVKAYAPVLWVYKQSKERD
jgi:hypothetical protein